MTHISFIRTIQLTSQAPFVLSGQIFWQVICLALCHFFDVGQIISRFTLYLANFVTQPHIDRNNRVFQQIFPNKKTATRVTVFNIKSLIIKHF